MLYPDFEEFEKLSQKGNLIPVSAEIMADLEQSRPAAPAPVAVGLPPQGRGRGRMVALAAMLFIGGGRRAGVRPADLVGAITAEAGVPGSVIGAIQIADSFSLVDVADEVVEQVVRALRTATIRGRTFLVRLDRDVR